MIEFNAQEGGRYTYVDDIVNLQDIALSLNAIFDECDNFVLSGCEVSGTSISAGFVYINGKLRRFSGATGITSWPQYIYESNSTESVAYASGNDKVGRTVYGCSIAKTVPTTLDTVTGKIPSSLIIRESGATTFKEAFIGKYALLINGASQTVAGSVTFNDLIASTLKTVSETLQSGNAVQRKYFSGGNLIHESQNGTGDNYKMTVEDGVGFRFYINDTLVLTIGPDSAIFNIGISNGTSGSGKASFGSVVVDGGAIYNATAADNDGSIDINMVSYNGNSSFFRDTFIGNGKGKALIAIYGSDNQVVINAPLELNDGNSTGITLISDKVKTDNALQKSLVWKDKSLSEIAFAGFTNTTDQIFRIINNLSAVEITGDGFVNIGPAIKENGTLLSDKYVMRSGLDELISGKANASDVYTQTAADNKFATKDGGLTQFVSSSRTQAVLRNEIGAASASDYANTAKLDQFLSDMATSEANKKTIRDNIGAAGVDEFQKKLTDTGWIACSGQTGLYARQIGNVVSIQGTITTKHSGTVFSVPNAIDSPTHAVYQSITFSNKVNWSCSIDGNSRNCTVLYCNGGCNKSTHFSMTYMV